MVRDMLTRAGGIFRRLTVGQKFLTVIVVEIISYTTVTFIALAQIHSVGDEVERMAHLYIPLFTATEEIRSELQEGRLNFKEIVFVGDRVVYDRTAEETFLRERGKYEAHQQTIDREIDRAEEMLRSAIAEGTPIDAFLSGGTPSLLGRLDSIRHAAFVHDRRVRKIFRHIEDGSFLMGLELVDEVEASEEMLTRELDALIASLDELRRASVDYASRVERSASIFVIGASLVTVCMVITFFVFVVRNSLTRPLRILTEAIETFSDTGDKRDTALETELARRQDELGYVGRRFSRLKQDLWEQRSAIQAAKTEAERANRAKSYFLAAASHDLRQPLHALQMYIEVLRHRLTDPDDLALVGEIDAVSNSTGTLLNTLLDVSQLEAGVIKPQVVSFPIDDLLCRVFRAYYPSAYKKGLSLHLVHSSAMVRSDPVLLERVLGNFMSNAVRYTEAGGILIGCRLRGEELSVEILDTGAGIDPGSLPRVFDDFYQVQNLERDRGKGLGLGLAIARRLCHTLGHRIETDSLPGKGSRFAVVVARASVAREAERAPARAPLPARGEASQLEGVSILLVEDDAAVRTSTAQLLSSWGCRVHPAASFDAAVGIAADRRSALDLVIADYRLPGPRNGAEAIVRLRDILGWTVPAILVTGESNRDALGDIRLEKVALAIKPFHPAKLRALVSAKLRSGARPPGEPAEAQGSSPA